MGTLTLVRHGQASFLSDDYDRLSPLGQQQARLLGAYWADDCGLAFQRVYVGPHRRHRQTHDALADVYRERGLPWPEPTLLPELAEHQGASVVPLVLPDLARRDDNLGALARTYMQAPTPRDYLTLYWHVAHLWAADELRLPQVEPWADFQARVRLGIEKMIAGIGSGKRVVAFTSGGFVAAAVGHALDLSGVKTIELSWLVRNASYSEFLFSDGRFSLSTFNAVPHTFRDGLITRI